MVNSSVAMSRKGMWTGVNFVDGVNLITNAWAVSL